MRVATYTQPSPISRGSLAAMVLLVAAVLLGTNAVPRVLPFFVPATTALITPLWLLLYLGAALGLLLGQGVNWVSWLVRYRILLVLLLSGTAASISWSLVPFLSLERIVHLIGSSVVAIYLGFTVPLLTLLRTLAVVLGGLLLASALAAVGLPSLGIEQYEGVQVWTGVFVSKNALGFWSAVAVLLYVTLADSVDSFGTRVLCYLMAGVSLVTLVFSQSATSLVCLVIGGAAALFMFVAPRFRLGFVRMGVVAIVIGGLAAFAVANIDTAELVGRSGDLTGRGEVWRQTWNLIVKKPLTGYGYGVLWFPADGDSWIQESLLNFTWTVHHAHNGFLQVASEVGLPLAVIAVLMTVQQVIEILYCQYQRQQAGALFVLGFTVAYLVGNYSEARFLVSRELYWMLFIALPISMLRQIDLVAFPAGFGPGPAPPPALRPHPGRGVPASAAPGTRFGPAEPALGVGRAAAPMAGPTSTPRSMVVVRAPGAPPAAADARGGDDIGGGFGEEIDAAIDGHHDDDDVDFLDDDDLDATLGSLTLADADIDLGVLSGSPAPVALVSDADAGLDEAAVIPACEPEAPPYRADRFGSPDGLPDGPLKGPINGRDRSGAPGGPGGRDAAKRAPDPRLDARFDTDGLDELFDASAAARRKAR